jgi:hypothetical protein
MRPPLFATAIDPRTGGALGRGSINPSLSWKSRDYPEKPRCCQCAGDA